MGCWPQGHLPDLMQTLLWGLGTVTCESIRTIRDAEVRPEIGLMSQISIEGNGEGRRIGLEGTSILGR